MKVGFSFFKPGVESSQYGLAFEMAAVPQHGDIIVVRRHDTPSDSYHPEETFRVRRTEWSLRSLVPSSEPQYGEPKLGTVALVTVECEFVDPKNH